MDLGLADARVLITGGASNIGRGIVHAFAAEGSRIVLSDIDHDQAERVGQEALDRGAADVEVVVGDLTAEGEAQRAADRAVEAWDGIDVLVNNAGWSVPGFIAKNTDRAAHRQHASLPSMMKNRLVGLGLDLAEPIHAAHIVNAVHRLAPGPGAATSDVPRLSRIELHETPWTERVRAARSTCGIHGNSSGSPCGR